MDWFITKPTMRQMPITRKRKAPIAFTYRFTVK